MLVLSRKIGQTIVIGNGIEITVVDLRGDQVRLGIQAPRDIPVNRKEVLLHTAENGSSVPLNPTSITINVEMRGEDVSRLESDHANEPPVTDAP